MEIFYLPVMAMGLVLIVAPFLALIPAFIFGGLYIRTKRLLVLVAALLWVIYSVYELAMKLRILCSGECNIRVDLLLIYPLLIIVSLMAIVSAIRGWKSRKPV